MGPRRDDWFGAWALFGGPGFPGFDRAVRYAARDPEAMAELRDILDRATDEIEAWSQRNRERRKGASGPAGG